MARYNEIFKLVTLCTENNIETKLYPLFDGYKLSILKDSKEVTDAIQHRYSYGNREDLLETWDHEGEVVGGLTAEECLTYINKYLK